MNTEWFEFDGTRDEGVPTNAPRILLFRRSDKYAFLEFTHNVSGDGSVDCLGYKFDLWQPVYLPE